ncbi:hypothetical protein SNE40_009359 [Patella caerulea]|uniref:Dystrophin n=1 Tax=Patella caerulea TaxID=87958 RepID=A0AAN8JYX0_PATCE
MEDRYLLEKKIEECSLEFNRINEELRVLSKTAPSSVEQTQLVQLQYQQLEKQLVQYKPKLEELNGRLDGLRTSGQIRNVEAILLLGTQYEQLIDRISQFENKCQQSVFMRQQFEEQTVTLESSVADIENEIKTVNETELPLSDRLARYKVIFEKLVSIHPEVVVAMDKAQQLTIDKPAHTMTSEEFTRVQTIQYRMETLRKCVEDKTLEYKTLIKGQDDFNIELDKTMAWLEEKQTILASCGTLDLSPEKVHSEQKKHEKISEEAKEKINTMKTLTEKEQSHYEQLQEPLPNEAEVKLKQMNNLQTAILEAISKKEQYLKDAQIDRKQFKNSMRQVTEWIHGAQEHLDSGYDGLDYDSIDQTLSEFTDYFSEASLCQDELDQITELSEKLVQSLDVNDKETLQQSIHHVNQQLPNIMSTSQTRQKLLEQKSIEWREFLEAIDEMNETIEILEADWTIIDQGSISDKELLQIQLQALQEFLDKIEEKRPAIGELNDRSRSLERVANMNSRTIITRLITNVNNRWHSLVTQAENKQTNLKEICGQWEGFSSTMTSVDDILHKAEVKLSSVNVSLIRYEELVDQVNTLQEVCEMLNELEQQIDIMKKSGQDLQKTLPTAEAKILSQDTSTALLERYERLQRQAKEQLQTIKDELCDRESFKSDITELIEGLNNTKANVVKISPDTETTEILTQIKVYERDISSTMEQARTLEKIQEGKYRVQGRELPEDMLAQLSTMREVEASVTQWLKQTAENLLHLKEDREIFLDNLTGVTTWLNTSETQLQEPIVNIKESMAVHNNLLSDLDNFKEELDKLRSKGGDIVRHSWDPNEKQSVQKNLANVNRQWNSVQAKVAEKTRKLNEAFELHTTFQEATVTIKQWADKTAVQVGSDIDWSDFDNVRDDLKTTKRVSTDIAQSREKLKSLKPVVKQLNQVTDIEEVNTTMSTLTQQIEDLHAHTNTKLKSLQDVNTEIDAYEREMEDVTVWLEHARTVLSSRDLSHDMKEELRLSKKLLTDATTNKEKAKNIVQKYKELHVDVFPSHGSKIITEISQLEAEVSDRVEQLTTAVNEQEQYQTELLTLNNAVQEAQQKLLASPVMASSVEALKQQIAERDNLAAQIKNYQDRINSLNEKSRQLSERSRHHYPMFMRRRFFPDSSGHSSLISSYNSRDFSSLPIIGHSHFDSGIDSTGLTSSRYSDVSVQPDLSWSNMSDKSTNTMKNAKISNSESALFLQRDTSITHGSVQSLPAANSRNVELENFTQKIVPPLELGSDLDIETSQQDFLSERVPNQSKLYRTSSGGNIFSKSSGRSKVTFGTETGNCPYKSYDPSFRKTLTSSKLVSVEDHLNSQSLTPLQNKSFINSPISSPTVCSTPVLGVNERDTATNRVIGMRHKLWNSTGRVGRVY